MKLAWLTFEVYLEMQNELLNGNDVEWLRGNFPNLSLSPRGYNAG